MTTTIHITRGDNGGHNVKLQIGDGDAFNLAIRALKSIIEFEFRSYDPDVKAWTVNEDGYEQLILWVNHCRQSIDAEIKWQQPPPRPRRQQSPLDPYAALHLLPTAPPEVVKAAYKALATISHPDKEGGDVVAMQNINRAYAQLTS